MQYEDFQRRGDDTAANGIKFTFCELKNWSNQITNGFEGKWGNWKGRKMCPENTWVNGFQIQFQDPQGAGDDTALNGLKFSCLDPKTMKKTQITVWEGLWGIWL